MEHMQLPGPGSRLLGDQGDPWHTAGAGGELWCAGSGGAPVSGTSLYVPVLTSGSPSQANLRAPTSVLSGTKPCGDSPPPPKTESSIKRRRQSSPNQHIPAGAGPFREGEPPIHLSPGLPREKAAHEHGCPGSMKWCLGAVLTHHCPQSSIAT